MVDYTHLPILEKLRQIDSRVQTLNDTVSMTQANVSPKMLNDLAEFVHTKIEEAKSELEYQKEAEVG
jgi:hypothetical protein